jgi:hypothetical protein
MLLTRCDPFISFAIEISPCTHLYAQITESPKQKTSSLLSERYNVDRAMEAQLCLHTDRYVVDLIAVWPRVLNEIRQLCAEDDTQPAVLGCSC